MDTEMTTTIDDNTLDPEQEFIDAMIEFDKTYILWEECVSRSVAAKEDERLRSYLPK